MVLFFLCWELYQTRLSSLYQVWEMMHRISCLLAWGTKTNVTNLVVQVCVNLQPTWKTLKLPSSFIFFFFLHGSVVLCCFVSEHCHRVNLTKHYTEFSSFFPIIHVNLLYPWSTFYPLDLVCPLFLFYHLPALKFYSLFQVMPNVSIKCEIDEIILVVNMNPLSSLLILVV